MEMEGTAIKLIEASDFVNNKALFKGEYCSAGFKVQDGDRAAH